MNTAIRQLQIHQNANGGFSDTAGKLSVLYTAVLLSALCKAKNQPGLDSIKKKAADFLLSRKDSEWHFGENLLADFCALSALVEYNKSLIDGAALANIIGQLTKIEQKEGGPYKSPDGQIDAMANAAIGRFLRLYEVELPSLEPFLKETNEYYDLPETPALRAARTLLLEMPEQVTQPTSKFNTDEKPIINLIKIKVDKRFNAFSSEFKKTAKAAIKKTIRGNPDKQMSLIALYTRQALGEKGKKISDDVVADMGLANIFFWTAFIIYDDFWDQDEAADPKVLPVANIFARHYIDFFSTLLPEKTGFHSFFHDLMDDLDAANAWETEHCRTRVESSTFYIPKELPNYGDYDNKYRPASGHILGPVAQLIMLGYDIQSSNIKNLIAYFKHYLIVMQLNDDAHDWEEDMLRGHLSTVVTILLADLKKEGWNKPTIDLAADLPELKKIFWFKTLKNYVNIARSHAAISREALMSIDAIDRPESLLRFIDTTENVALKAEKEHYDSQAFLNAYNT